MGVPLVRMKLLAFACGASFAGAVGVLFAAKQVFINPESFTFMESIGVLAMIILGGMGSIPGAILGAAVVTVLNLQVLKGLSLWLNELRNAGVSIFGFNLADLPTQLEPAKYERMVFGLILVLMMIFRPQGILPAKRRVRELRDATPAVSDRPGMKALAIACPLAAAAGAIIAFLPTVRAGFVNWDDEISFLSNPHYRGLGPAELRYDLTTTLLGHWSPLTWLTWSANYVLGGMDPWGYHLGERPVPRRDRRALLFRGATADRRGLRRVARASRR